MKLVKLENFELKVEPELLLLKPFKKLWSADKTKEKTHFMEFLSILYFLVDPRSDYQYIIDEDDRLKEICESNGYEEPKWNKEETLCRQLYEKLTTTTSLDLLKATKIAVNKVKKFLEQVDLFEEDDKGKPKYTVNTITSAIKLVPQLAKDLAEAEKALGKEVEEQGRARGGDGAKTLMDDGILL